MPIQMCPIEIPDNHEFVRWGRCKGAHGERYLWNGKVATWYDGVDSVSSYVIVREVQPVPKYIPFTSETFRPHRDRWVRWKDTKVEFHISWCHEHEFGIENSNFDFALVWNQLEFINPDGTTEPFGKKVEG